jgi:hypothetical protein
MFRHLGSEDRKRKAHDTYKSEPTYTENGRATK